MNKRFLKENCSHRLLCTDMVRRIFNVCLLSALLSVCLSSPLSAIGTVRGEAVQLRLNDVSMEVAPPVHDKNHCLHFLKKSNQPMNMVSYNSRTYATHGRYSQPTALSFLIGVRYVLGPKEVVKSPKRLKIGLNMTAEMNEKERYSVAIANYRACKKQSLLKQK